MNITLIMKMEGECKIVVECTHGYIWIFIFSYVYGFTWVSFFPGCHTVIALSLYLLKWLSTKSFCSLVHTPSCIYTCMLESNFKHQEGVWTAVKCCWVGIWSWSWWWVISASDAWVEWWVLKEFKWWIQMMSSSNECKL